MVSPCRTVYFSNHTGHVQQKIRPLVILDKKVSFLTFFLDFRILPFSLWKRGGLSPIRWFQSLPSSQHRRRKDRLLRLPRQRRVVESSDQRLSGVVLTDAVYHTDAWAFRKGSCNMGSHGDLTIDTLDVEHMEYQQVDDVLWALPIWWGCHADTMEHSYTNSMVWVVIYGYGMGMDGTDMVLFSPTYT